MSTPRSGNRNAVLDVRPLAPRMPSRWSWIGLCSTSFFLAEVNGVTMPFVNTYLTDCGWSYGTIGVAASSAGLVSWLMNLPGGFLIDAARHSHRLMLGAAALLVGTCCGLLPLVPASGAAIGALLIVAAVAKPLFGPLTNALALRLVGHARFDRAVGLKQGWDHAGNIAAALTALALVQRFPVDAVFFGIAAASVLASASVVLIRPADLGERVADLDPTPRVPPLVRLVDLLRERRVAFLLASAVLFHLANAPVMPLVAQKVKYVGGTNSQVAAVVLVAQSVMIPASVLAGSFGSRWGHKRLLGAGFLVLPLRIALYALTDDPSSLVAIQALDGLGAGIFGVASVAICADVTRGRGRFSTLIGALGTSVGLGGAAGPIASGLMVQYLGFSAAFCAFAAIAATAAMLFVGWMPGDRRTRTDAPCDRLANSGVALETE